MNRTLPASGKSLWTLLLLLPHIAMFAGCSKPTPVEFTNLCRKENNNELVSVEGYLKAGVSVLCSSREGTRACGLDLFEKPDGGGKISVFVEEGTGKSQMEPLPMNYGKDNLKIRAEDGQVIAANERVRLVGIANNGADVVDSSYSICFMNVEEIQRP